MKQKPVILFIALLISSILNVFADSPLTSTDFSKAYLNESIIAQASNAKGVLTDQLMDYLIDQNKPIAIKMALINKLGWNSKGKSNSLRFFTYLNEKRGYVNEADFIVSAKGDELLSMAYLKAMDNYFVVDEAIKYAEFALKCNKQSFTYQIIAALIKAQKSLDDDWCKVYRLADVVRKNTSLKKDIKTEAIAIIFEYMEGYKDNCTNQKH